MPKRVYWDSCTFLGLINQEQGKSNECTGVWDEAAAGKVVIYTSFFTFAEVFKTKCDSPAKPLTEGEDKRIEQILRQKWVKPMVVDERIGVASRRLMRGYPECKKPSDGVHLATALALSVDEMHTYDNSDLLKLTGRVNCANGKPLTICRPAATPKPPERQGRLIEM